MSDYLIQNLRFLSAQAERGQAGAGTAAGVGQPAVSKILTGKTQEPGYKTVLGLARHFGVSVDDLLNRDIEQDGKSAPSQPTGLDVAKLASLIETLDGAIADSKRDVPASTKARFLASLYADSHAHNTSSEALRALIKSILGSLEEA